MKVSFYTLGCKVNSYETDLMKQSFKKLGYDIEERKKSLCDIYVINSCSVTNLATRKTRQAISRAKRVGKIVVLAGCYAQEIKDDDIGLDVDVIIGNEEKKDIGSIVDEYIKNHGIKNSKVKVLKMSNILYKVSDISKINRYSNMHHLEMNNTVRESIKIEDGCNNFCSYCIIPYVRGRVRSRNIDDIVIEIETLVKNGVKEVVLVGIEIASYGKDLNEDLSLIDVIERVDRIDGLHRIRLRVIRAKSTY